MSVMPFLRNFLAAQGDNVTKGVVKAMVELDPESASKADLATMEQDLDRAGRAIAKLRADLVSEQKELEAVEKQYGQLMGAAEVLQKRIAAGADASVQTSLTNLLNKIEHIVPELDRDRQTVKDTESLLHEAETAYAAKAEGLRQAKHNLEDAKHDLAHAKIEEERADERAQQAAVVAGLKESTTSNLSTALNSMRAAASDARQRAESHNMKAAALTGDEAAEDANVKSALAEANPVPEKSLSDRLNSLRR